MEHPIKACCTRIEVSSTYLAGFETIMSPPVLPSMDSNALYNCRLKWLGESKGNIFKTPLITNLVASKFY